MGVVVPAWTGRDTVALRKALRLTTRAFAARLGVNEAAVNNWAKRGDQIQLLPETQQLLDIVLADAPADAVERFDALRRRRPAIGDRSAERTGVLLRSVLAATDHRLVAPVDPDARSAIDDYLASASRCFTLTGPPGSGKTHLTRVLAADLGQVADTQLHAVSAWDLATVDLATEILRYASHPVDGDPLLALEDAAAELTRACLVIIDGIDAPENLEPIARQVDAILRQVSTGHLRFWLVVRTPPTVDFSPFPILAACIHPGPAPYASHVTGPWDQITARTVWDTTRTEADPQFNDLPERVQDLARLPLYMRLLATTGATNTPGDLTAYRLVDHCVTQILAATGIPNGLTREHLARLAHDTSPHLALAGLTAPTTTTASPAQEPIRALVHGIEAGTPVWVHDLIGEYFAATRIANLITSHGRPTAVNALNELSLRASRAASARGVFEFVVLALDDRAADQLTSLLLAPTIAAGTTLALIITLAGHGTRFATDEVLRTSAARSTASDAIDLARALLGHPHLARALGHHFDDWLIGLLRTYGAALWPDIAGHVENWFDYRAAQRLLSRLDLNTSDEAIFLAHHYRLFAAQDTAGDHHLDALITHPDWRVRAALAQGLLTSHPTASHLQQLAADGDYKVRAALARALGDAEISTAAEHLPGLLIDPNWHVRASALAATGIHPSIVSSALDTITSDPTWTKPPAHVATLAARLRLLATPASAPVSPATDRALFGLLRELRTGWITLPDLTRHALIQHGTTSGAHWLVATEAAALDHPGAITAPAAFRQAFRALRGTRRAQVALDLHTLDDALTVAHAAVEAGADLIEVGDPLIKTVGVQAIEVIKRAAPEAIIVAEMMSADWGRDQVELAAYRGADVVQLIGPATTASVSAAVDAGRRLGVPIVLDIPLHADQAWIRDMERTGIDGVTITTNIDQGTRGRAPIELARDLRDWTRLPVAVSGGVSPTDHTILTSPYWDILIVGRAVTDAVHPAQAAREMVALVHQTSAK